MGGVTYKRAGEHSTARRAGRLDASLGTGGVRTAEGGVGVVCEEPRILAAVGALTEARDRWDRAYRGVAPGRRTSGPGDRGVRATGPSRDRRSWLACVGGGLPSASCQHEGRGEHRGACPSCSSSSRDGCRGGGATPRRQRTGRYLLPGRLAQAAEQVLAYGAIGRELTGLTSGRARRVGPTTGDEFYSRGAEPRSRSGR